LKASANDECGNRSEGWNVIGKTSGSVDGTAATGEIAVFALALSGSVFGPWLVVVPISLATPTEPLAGAV